MGLSLCQAGLVAVTVALALTAACASESPAGSSSSSSSSGGTASPAPHPFSPDVAATRVVFEIDYQPGAEPYTGSSVAFGDTWRLFRTNAEKLFEGTGMTVDVPVTLDRMERLDDVDGTQFSSDAILEIARAHRAPHAENDVVAYYVVWLAGYLEEDGAPKKGVLGVSLGRTGVIAMFKPVIESAGLPLLPDLARVVEQTTLIHEVGHAVGLVANGVPVTSAHHDAERGAHCTNDRCIMYWAIEGVDAARDYAQRHVTSSDVVLFADDCLADIAAARR